MIKLRNNKFLNKSELYLMIDLLRKHLGISVECLPLNSVDLAYTTCKNLIIEEIDFEAISICGILYKGSNTTSIALNSNRSRVMQNFDCGHELIHYFCHDIKECQCVCTEAGSSTRSITQISSFEWQANEGAAELLVPYRHFIPTYVNLSQKFARDFCKTPPEKELAEIYNVTPGVIRYRIDSLNYEIYQYLEHGNIDNIEILSQTKQKQRGWNKRHEQFYCTSCLSPINIDYDYCPICGKKLEKEGIHIYQSILRGAGYMKYEGIELNEYNRPLRCPVCDNEEIQDDANYCMICGRVLVNQCQERDCPKSDIPLPGNARYCPYCGSKTTYYEGGYLEDFNKTEPITESSSTTPTGLDSISYDDIPF